MNTFIQTIKRWLGPISKSHLRITRWQDDEAYYEQVDNLETGAWWVKETRKVPYDYWEIVRDSRYAG